MKTPIKCLSIIAVVLMAEASLAKTDVAATLQQLKTNEENAKANHKQYETNADISGKNIVEVTNAIKQLREQRTKLTSNAQNLEKNRAILDKMKAKLVEYKSEEEAQMKREDAQIAQLRAALEKLEANKMKREQNLQAYDQKIAEVDQEKGEWDGQKQVFANLQQELDKKEKAAVAERDRWVERKKGYRAEADKWQKEAKLAEETRVRFDKLKD